MSEEQKPVGSVESAGKDGAADQHNQNQPDKTEHAASNDKSKLQRFKAWYVQRKKWTIPATVLLSVLLLIIIPFTRYAIAGLAVKQNLTVSVVDTKSNTPVSGATVSAGSIISQTDGSGKATLHQLKPGSHQVSFVKKYYQSQSVKITVPVMKQKTIPQVKMTATGRQVKITVNNIITGSPINGAKIGVAGANYKTDDKGIAVVVVPAGVSTQKATVSHDGYNNALDVTIKVSDSEIAENNLALTPSGKVYFLSKLSGKIDVVKTNLDGTNRQTVLAGTGKEDDRGTVLLASRDWKYLALLSKRAGGSPALYLIGTADDKLTTIDDGDAVFTPAGWVNDSFVYSVSRNSVQIWQPNRQALKSYDATDKKLITLDQTTASGTNSYDYISELMGSVYANNDQVLYIKNWTAAYGQASSTAFTSKQATFNSIKADGSAKKAIKSFGLAPGTTALDISVEAKVENPSSIDLKFSDGAKDNFYTYANGQVKDDPTGKADSFYSADYPTYLQSPSGDTTFWAEARDGKNTLFIGDQSGQGGKQIATLSDYFTYGWFTDNYVLVSKNSSELYVMPNSGSKTPVKISDYHKPSATFYGYGGGYGGL